MEQTIIFLLLSVQQKESIIFLKQKTAHRDAINTRPGTPEYVAIADREPYNNGYKHYITDAPEYNSLEAAYDAYEKVIAKDYPDYKKHTPPNSSSTTKATDRF